MSVDAAHRTATWTAARDRLIAAGLLLPTGIDGVYGRSAGYERVIAAVDALVHQAGRSDEPTLVDYPPILPREVYDRVGYVGNFPQLAALVGGVRSEEVARRRQAGLDPVGGPAAELHLETDLALAPACCYSVYPSLRGDLDESGATYEIATYCVRLEPSVDPMRLQAFRQREHIRVGSAEQIARWRAAWIDRATDLLDALGLAPEVAAASDPFFGRTGRVLAASQREQALKLEWQVEVHGIGEPTACGSINDHQQRFGELFGIRLADGTTASSACIGIGLERCTTALFLRHGVDVAGWPAAVRAVLWP